MHSHSLNNLLWALDLKDIPPVVRLTAVFLATKFQWSSEDLDDFEGDDEPDRYADLVRAAAWIGCSEPDVIEAAVALREHGLRFSEVRAGIIIFRMPLEPPRAEPVRAGKPVVERQISVYVMSAGTFTKVGISAAPENRLYSLQCANPLMKLSLEFHRSGDSSFIRKVERDAHARLAAHSVGNEWFAVSPAVAITVVTELLGVPRA